MIESEEHVKTLTVVKGGHADHHPRDAKQLHSNSTETVYSMIVLVQETRFGNTCEIFIVGFICKLLQWTRLVTHAMALIVVQGKGASQLLDFATDLHVGGIYVLMVRNHGFQ